jgi:hypothetical protein
MGTRLPLRGKHSERKGVHNGDRQSGNVYTYGKEHRDLSYGPDDATEKRWQNDLRVHRGLVTLRI